MSLGEDRDGPNSLQSNAFRRETIVAVRALCATIMASAIRIVPCWRTWSRRTSCSSARSAVVRLLNTRPLSRNSRCTTRRACSIRRVRTRSQRSGQVRPTSPTCAPERHLGAGSHRNSAPKPVVPITRSTYPPACPAQLPILPDCKRSNRCRSPRHDRRRHTLSAELARLLQQRPRRTGSSEYPR